MNLEVKQSKQNIIILLNLVIQIIKNSNYFEMNEIKIIIIVRLSLDKIITKLIIAVNTNFCFVNL